jgi:hypothetical protein
LAGLSGARRSNDSVPGDKKVIAADGLALSFQCCAYVGGMPGSVDVERKNVEPHREALDLMAIVLRPCRFRRAVQQLGTH